MAVVPLPAEPLLVVALLATLGRLGAAFDVRVAKGLYTRPYNTVRLSVIGGSPEPGLPSEDAPSIGPSAYNAPFIHRWTSKTLQSKLVSVGDAGETVDFGNGEHVELRLPPPGSGVTGLFFSDPCFTSKGGFKCPNGEKFQILERLTFILNRLLESDEFHFWGMLGDNFYDILGGVSAEFFWRLSLKAKSKPLLVAVGNHDFWLGGSPPGGPGDQLGYGFMQFYGQDTVAGQGPTPYNFAGNPDAMEIARPENFIYGTQIGDLAFFSFSSAHDWPSTQPHAASFCAWAGREPTVHTVIVLGHWDVCDLGCAPGMDTPSVFARMRTMSGCSTKSMLLFVGHQHCNRAVNSSGPLDAHAFVLGGTGMWGPGCSQFGFTVLQSNPGAPGGPNVRVDHFPVAASDFGGKYIMLPTYWNAPPNYDRFEALAACLDRSGYAGCRSEHGQSLRALSTADIVVPRELRASDRISSSSRPSEPVAVPTFTATTTTSTTTPTTTTSTSTDTATATTTSSTWTSTSFTTSAVTGSHGRSPAPAPLRPPSAWASSSSSGANGEAWWDPLDIWATTSALARRATSTTVRSPEMPEKEHSCWEGLHDLDVPWPRDKVDWCCHELSLGCDKAVLTEPSTTLPPDSRASTTSGDTSNLTGGLDHVLQRKPAGTESSSGERVFDV